MSETSDCICGSHVTSDRVIQYIGPDGRTLMYFDKDCPVHGIHRAMKKEDDACSSPSESNPSPVPPWTQ